VREIQFDRQVLYDEVWQTPISRLASKYRLSDNGLRKVCVALNVPLPPRGHWAKVAAGHLPGQTPLPSFASRTTFTSRPATEVLTNPFATEEDTEWLEERVSFEKDPSNRVLVDDPPHRWHPELKEAKHAYDAAAKEAEIWKRDFERAEAKQQKYPGKVIQSTYEDRKWGYFRDRGSVLCDTHRTAPLRGGPQTYRRALAIVNAIFVAAGKRGVQPVLDPQEGRFCLELQGTKIHFAVRERLEEHWRDELNSWTKKIEKKKHKKASGKLFIAIYKNGYDNKQISDSDLGDLGAAIFCPLYAKVVLKRQGAREGAERERRHQLALAAMEAEKARREAEEEVAKEKERLAAAERQREAALLEEAENWDRASRIRRYVAHVGPSTDNPELASWANWALSVADRLDPTQRRSG
jgi:hypothetical protein